MGSIHQVKTFSLHFENIKSAHFLMIVFLIILKSIMNYYTTITINSLIHKYCVILSGGTHHDISQSTSITLL